MKILIANLIILGLFVIVKCELHSEEDVYRLDHEETETYDDEEYYEEHHHHHERKFLLKFRHFF